MEGDIRKKWLDYEKKHPNIMSREISMNINKDKCETFRLKHPFTCMVSGMTGCGKTTWVQRLVHNKADTIKPTPQRILWCYSRWQPVYEEMMQTIPEIEFVRGIPTNIEHDDYFDVNVRNLIVIDDQMSSASNDKQVINLFTQGSHHRNLSVIYLVQNLFHQGKGNRDISLNCHYLVIFKNPRDKLQILTLAKQMYPRKTGYFLQKYEEAVSRPFGYLFIDLKTTTPDHCRLRTNVLPGEGKQEVSYANNEVSRELVKYLKQQSAELPPTASKLQSLQKQMGDLLQNSNINTDQKARQYVQLQNNFLQYKKKLQPSSPFPQATLATVEPPTHFIPPEPEPDNEDPFVEPPARDSEQVSSEEDDQPSSPVNDSPFTSAVSPSPQFQSSALLTPPSTISPPRKNRKRPRYPIKNYLDSDSHKTFGPFSSAHRLRRSQRIRRNPYKWSKLEV